LLFYLFFSILTFWCWSWFFRAGDPLFDELWHACAGPLVTVPRVGDLVFYFPQGHIEQVPASSPRSIPLPRRDSPRGGRSSPVPALNSLQPDLLVVCFLVPGRGLHEPGRGKPDAPLRSALQAALPRHQRRAQGASPPPPFLAQFSGPISLCRAGKISSAFFCALRNSNRLADLFVLGNFCQAETDTDEVYAQVMLMPEPEVSTTLNLFLFLHNLFLFLDILFGWTGGVDFFSTCIF
jgi:hypothetical protein